MEADTIIASQPVEEKSNAANVNTDFVERVTGVQKLGCSLAVIIPAKAAANMGIIKGTHVKISAEGKKKLVIEKV